MKITDQDAKTYATLSYALVMIVVGIPVWWHTTDVERAPLPFDRIEEMNLETLKQNVPITVISTTSNSIDDCLSDSTLYTFKVEKRELNDRERKIISESSTIQDLDNKINAQIDHTPLGSILLVEVPSHFFDSDKNIGIGQFRLVFYAKGTSICDVMNVVRQAVLGENVINTMTSSIREPIKIHDVDKSKWSQRKGVPSPEYDILLSLLVPEPELNLVTWDIENAIQHILQPFLDEIGDLYSFTVKSQVLYLTSLGLSSVRKTVSDSGNERFLISEKDLGLAINMESKLVSHVSSRPSFNFIAYVPTIAQTPLHIEPNAGGIKIQESNSFLVPRWGGVSIWNLYNTTSRNRERFDDVTMMRIVITQLRSLLGLQSEQPEKLRNVQYLPRTEHLITLWEKDFLSRLKLEENLVTTRVTLQSLAHLLSKISNIVITEEVAEDVQSAVKSYDEAISCLGHGQPPQTCFESSKDSFVTAERVFFENSLLALLYFPEDQKYAIYIPLFLPISFSFVGCILPILKEFFKRFFGKGNKNE